MLIGRPDHALKLLVWKADLILLTPLKKFLPHFLFTQSKKPKFRCQADGAVVSIARLHVTLPDRLNPGAGKREMRKVLRMPEVIFKRLFCDLSHLTPETFKKPRSVSTHGNIRLPKEACFIGY